MTISNTKWVLKSRPSGLVKEDNFELITEELSELNEAIFFLKINIYLLIQLKECG